MSDFYALHTATNYTGTSNELRGCINDWKNMLILDDFLKIPQEFQVLSLHRRSSATAQQSIREVNILQKAEP